MEMWIKINGEKRKLQGSFLKVMEEIYNSGEGEISLLAFNAGTKERRRLKRLLRWYDRDLREVARQVLIKYYKSDRRKLKRRIEELKKKARYISKGQIYYCPEIMKEVENLKREVEEIDRRIGALQNK